LTNSEKSIKFAKNYDFKMAPFLIRLYQKRGHLNWKIITLESLWNTQKMFITLINKRKN
jgi:hypothetical protein